MKSLSAHDQVKLGFNCSGRGDYNGAIVLLSVVLKVLSLWRVRFRLDIRNKIILRKSDDTLEQSAQRGGGVTIPGGVQEKGRCDTEGHDLVGMAGMG